MNWIDDFVNLKRQNVKTSKHRNQSRRGSTLSLARRGSFLRGFVASAPLYAERQGWLRGSACLATIALIHAAGGCGDLFLNQTASLGGNLAGTRGAVRIVFINHTPHRAIFTAGTYDQLSPDYAPDIVQFGPSEGDTTLGPEQTSETISIDCARVFGIGSPRLFELIRANLAAGAFDENALVDGVEFETVEQDGSPPVLAGTAPAFEALLGVDFPCNSLLIIRFEPDDLGPAEFRVDFELVVSESDR